VSESADHRQQYADPRGAAWHLNKDPREILRGHSQDATGWLTRRFTTLTAGTQFMTLADAETVAVLRQS
jgi:hypothetical protein